MQITIMIGNNNNNNADNVAQAPTLQNLNCQCCHPPCLNLVQ
jgi:hypothetical protein